MVTILMVWIKRLFAVIIFLLMLMLLVSFTASNTGEVQLELLGWHIVPLKISSLVVVSFILGGVTGLLVSVLSISRLRLRNASLLRKVRRRDEELQKLRNSSLKGLTDA